MRKSFAKQGLPKRIVFFWAAIILLINGCEYLARELSVEDLVGDYVGYYELFEKQQMPETQKGFYEGWIHKLELKKDGTYVFLYTDADGKEMRYSGKWEYPAFKYDDNPDPSQLILRNLGIPYAHFQVQGSWMPEIYKDSTGRVRIVIDGDRSFYLIKVIPGLRGEENDS